MEQEYTSKQFKVAFNNYFEKLLNYFEGILNNGYKKHSSYNERNEKLLHYGVMKGCYDLVEFLLNKGINPNVPDKDGNTALHLAALKGDDKILSLLLHNDANINAMNEVSYTPLHVAAENKNKLVVENLLNNGANIHANDYIGNKPLHAAVRSIYNFDLAVNYITKVIDILLERGTNINVTNNYGERKHSFVPRLDTLRVVCLVVGNTFA